MQCQRLLILSCTARKRPDAGSLSAVMRYDGPAFRVYRRFRTAQVDNSVTMYVLSAEYGLIPEAEPVPLYERSMTRERAAELQSRVRDVLNKILREFAVEEALVCVGRRYLAALPDPPLPDSICWQVAGGPPGARLSKLHDWLYGSPPALPPPSANAPVRIRGREISLSREELLKVAWQRLSREPDAAKRWQAWYVSVGESRVAPKWLVSQATGLPVSAFSTGDARRVLAQLGVEVHRA